MKTKSLLLSLLLFASTANLLAAFPTNPLSGGGSGTQNDPYKIVNAADLMAVRDAVNAAAGAVGVATAYYELSNDIDMSANEWLSPIGNIVGVTANRFKGIFNGKGFKITGLFLGSSGTPNATVPVLGLFGNIEGATISNLEVAVQFYYSKSLNGGGLYTFGGLVSTIEAGTNVIDNCKVSGIISATRAGTSNLYPLRVGGIVGLTNTAATVKITNSYSDVQLTAINTVTTTSNGGAYCGGVMGEAITGSILDVVNCYTLGTITARSDLFHAYAGGIIGTRQGAAGSVKIYNCYAANTIDAYGYISTYIGGIIGNCSNLASLEIRNCNALNSRIFAYNTNTTPTAPFVNRIVSSITSSSNLKLSENYALDVMDTKGWQSWNGTSGTSANPTITSNATGVHGATLAASNPAGQTKTKLNVYVTANSPYGGTSLRSWTDGTTYPILIPTITGAATTNPFTTTFGTSSAVQSFTISGANLNANIVASAPNGFEVSSDGTTYGSTSEFVKSGSTVIGTLRIRLSTSAQVLDDYNSQNIVLSSTRATSVNITTVASGNAVYAKSLTIGVASIASKVYDGSATSGAVTAGTLSGFVSGAVVSVATAVGTYTDANVNTSKSATIVYTLADGTGLATNYSLANGLANGAITTKALSITEASIASKVYDGSATTGTVTAGTLSGFVGSETVTVSAVVGTYSNATVGTGKSATIVYTLANGDNGGLAANYSLANASANGDITSATTTVDVSSSNNSNSVISGTSSDVTVTGSAILTVNANCEVKSLATSTGTQVIVNSPLVVNTGGVTLAPNSKLELANTATVIGNVEVGTDAKLNFTATTNLSVTGDLILKADTTKTFSANIGTGGITVTGVVKYLKTMNDKKWFFMSFPCSIKVGDITRSDAGALVLNTDLFIKYYDGANRAAHGAGGAVVNWIAITNPTDSLVAYKGYVFGFRDGLGVKELSFPLKNKIVASESKDRKIPVLENAGSLGTNHNGWNLVGQPYLSKYAGANATGVNYMTLTSDGLRNYTTYSKIVGGLPTLDPFGAYFLQVGAPDSIPFTLGGRQSAPSAVTTSLSEVVKLNITTATGSDNTSLILDNDQSASYQIGQDMEKWIGTGTAKPQVYTVLGGINYAFNALSMSSVSNLPLGFYTQTSGSITIDIDATKAASLSKLLLTDNGTSPVSVTDLLSSNYTFTAAAGTNNTRFKITAQRVTTANVVENDADSPEFSITNYKLFIANLSGKSTVRIFDVLGRTLVNEMLNFSSVEIALPSVGVYSVLIESGAKRWTRKFVCQFINP